MNYLYIDQPQQLSDLCSRLGRTGWIALDTEFVREKTYFPQLCLIQVADSEEIAIIDILRLQDRSPLIALLLQPQLIKILHAAGQDMEVFFHLLDGRLPQSVVDTQLAAAAVGFGHQIGYAALVAQLYDVQLPKEHSRRDWRERPLPADALTYAADDVRYLGPMYQHLQAELEKRGRGHWLIDDYAALSNPERYVTQPKDAWRRLGAAQRLNSRSFRVIQQLASWRETLAQQHNRPRQWIVRDEWLLEVAERLPTSKQALANIKGTSQGLLHDHADMILAVVGEARNEAASPPPYPAPLTPEQLSQVEKLMNLAKRESLHLEVSQALLSTRKEIESLVRGERDLPVLRSWRRDVVGEAMLSVLGE